MNEDQLFREYQAAADRCQRAIEEQTRAWQRYRDCADQRRGEDEGLHRDVSPRKSLDVAAAPKG